MELVTMVGPGGLVVVRDDLVHRYESDGYKICSVEKPEPEENVVIRKKKVKKDESDS